MASLSCQTEDADTAVYIAPDEAGIILSSGEARSGRGDRPMSFGIASLYGFAHASHDVIGDTGSGLPGLLWGPKKLLEFCD